VSVKREKLKKKWTSDDERKKCWERKTHKIIGEVIREK
jgi:hypothetical protein